MDSPLQAGVDPKNPAVTVAGHDFVLVGEAAKRLGISHNSVLRRLKTGALKGFADHVNGYHYVSVRSIDDTLRLREELAHATTLPGDERFKSDAEIEKELGQTRS